MYTNCLMCGKPLSDPASLSLGLGPVCAAKNQDILEDSLAEGQPVLTDAGPLTVVGLVCRRLPDGRLACNIHQRHVHHSPTGFEIAYGGSGPADLALNVLAELLPRKPGAQGVKLYDSSRVSETAWRLHQPFKALIAAMDPEGGAIPLETIQVWIAQTLSHNDALAF